MINAPNYIFQATIFKGKNEIQQQKLGYQLAWEYMKDASLAIIVKDIAIGTRRLFISSGNYSVFWSTRLRERVEEPYLVKAKAIKGIDFLQKLTLFSLFLFLGSIFSCIYWHRYTMKSRLALYGIILMNWIGYARIFWSKARYRYIAEVVFCILTAMFIYKALGKQLLKTSNYRKKIKDFFGKFSANDRLRRLK